GLAGGGGGGGWWLGVLWGGGGGGGGGGGVWLGGGTLEGEGFQMPGAFVIEDAKVVGAYRHAHAGERVDVCGLVEGVGDGRAVVSGAVSPA
ncbi:MAG: hypothetical protein AAF797_16170, partial [Planctomycetota bacterium]